MKKVVREMKTRTREVFVPPVHRAGEAQVDFGHAAVKENGRLRKVVFPGRQPEMAGRAARGS